MSPSSRVGADLCVRPAKISVIMPSYNHGQYIGEAIQSVLDQTYPHWELIIADNFSTDHTQEVVRQFQDPRIQFLQFNNQGRIAAGRNFGISQATGEYLAFVDSDDIWMLDKLEKQIQVLENNPEISMVSSSFIPIGEVDLAYNHIAGLFKSDLDFQDFSYSGVLLSRPIITSSALVRCEQFLTILFDEDLRFMCIEDFDAWLRLVAKFGPVRVLKEPLVSYRVIVSKSRNIVKIAENMFVLLQKQQDLGLLAGYDRKKALADAHLAVANAILKMPASSFPKRLQAIGHYSKAFFGMSGLSKKMVCVLGVLLAGIPKIIQSKVISRLIKFRANMSV